LTPKNTDGYKLWTGQYKIKFYVFTVVPNKLGKVMKYEAKKMTSFIYLEMLNIEWVQIDPKVNRRVKCIILITKETNW